MTAAREGKGMMSRRKTGWRPEKTILVQSVTIAAMLGLAGCSALKVPTQQSIQGLTPDGTVSLTETFVAGVGWGQRDAEL